MSKLTKTDVERIGIKLSISIVMLLYFIFEYHNIKDIDTGFLPLYYLAMFVCSLSFFLTLFVSIRKISYIFLGVSFVFLLIMRNFVPEISDELNKIDCLEVGKVWDGEQKICRTDCVTWNKEQGCVKE